MGFKRSLMVFFPLLLLFWGAGDSHISFAQTLQQSELRDLIWDAAKEIENGNNESAKQLLEKAAAVDNPPPDVAALISQLLLQISGQNNSSAVSGQTSEEIQLVSEELSGMSKTELELYLWGLTDAVNNLFTPGGD